MDCGIAELSELFDGAVLDAVLALRLEVASVPLDDLRSGRLFAASPTVTCHRRVRMVNFMGNMIPESLVVPAPPNARRSMPAVVDAMRAVKAARIDAVAAGVLVVPPDVRCEIPFPVSSSKAAPTLSERERRDRVKAIDTVWNLVHRLGHACPRGREILDKDCVPIPALADVFVDAACGTRTASVIRGLTREVEMFLDWLVAFGADGFIDFEYSYSDLFLGAYLRSCRTRGKTVPGTARRAVRWLEETFHLTFHASSSAVMQVTQVAMASRASKAVSAAMLPVEAVIGLELLAINGPNPVVKIFAGLCAACASGVKRWSDLLHVSLIEDGEACFMFTSNRSKGKAGPYTWCVPRPGLSGQDWCAAWVKCLRAHKLPREDHLVPRPSASLSELSGTPARWADGNRALQTCLRLIGLPATAALEFSLHSMRHTFPTCARQLGLDGETVNTMGVLAGAFPMPARYDSIACASELLPKSYIARNIASGWRPSDRGAHLSPPVFPWGAAAASSETELASSASTVEWSPGGCAGTDIVPVEHVEPFPPTPFVPLGCARFAGKNSDFADMQIRHAEFHANVFQCFHKVRRVVHLYSDGGRSICGHLNVTLDDDVLPDIVLASSARFIDTSDVSCGFCKTCYGRCLIKAVVSEPRELVLSDSSSGSSVGTESDSSLSSRAGEVASAAE